MAPSATQALPPVTNSAPELASLLAFLGTRTSYAHHPARVEIRQTHASVVALAPPFVYKVKKAVRLGFLDFSTLAQRKADCEREIQLNRRLCPDVYEGIVPIYWYEGQLTFIPQGPPVEYAVLMKQLPDGYFLNQLVKNGQVTPAHLDQLVEVLVPFYTGQPHRPELALFGTLETIRATTAENLNTLERYAGDTVPAAALATIRFFTHAFLRTRASLFEKRRQSGWIKDCHGDLHTEHIHIQGSKVRIYDCIEFNDQLRYIDLAADVAFLAMDLDCMGRHDLSTYFVTQLAQRLGDTDLMQLLDFYKSYRACVRAKVENLRADESEISPAERAFSRVRARQYVRLALHYATDASTPAVWIVCGRVGSGKSTIAQSLASLLEGTYLSSDILRKESAGLPLYERTASEKREALYTDQQTDLVYQTLLQKALTQTKLGHRTIVDATFANARHRTRFIRTLTAESIPYYFIEVTATEALIRQRLTNRETGEAVVSDARLGDLETLSGRYQSPNEIPAAYRVQADTNGTVDATLTHILREVSRLHHHLPVEA